MYIKYMFIAYCLAITTVRSDNSITEESVTYRSSDDIEFTTHRPSDDIEFTTLEPVQTEEYENRTIETGNELWDNLMTECRKGYKISCIQKNVYSYLDSNLDVKGDYKVTESIVFKPNVVDFTKYSREYNEVDSDEDDDVDEARNVRKPPIEEVTNALYGKGMKFMMTHNLELQMPETFFDGATFKISPRAFEGNGALVHLELVPKEIVEDESRGPAGFPKIFKKKIRKLKYYIFYRCSVFITI